MMPYNDYFGNYITRTFLDIFPSFEEFQNATLDEGVSAKDAFSPDISDANLRLTYYLLAARYGASHTAFTDENMFKLNVFSLIHQFGPIWQKKLTIQKELRDTDVESLRLSETINNHAYHPSTPPATNDYGALNKIDAQNSTGYKQSKLSTYGMVLGLLDEDITEDYISRFKFLFIKVIEPDYPLWFVTENENIPLEDN